MKKIFVFGIIFILLSFLIPLKFNEVKAYNGELDPESYVTMPLEITIKDGIGTGTISLASSASDYTISYEKIDITANEMSNIRTKTTEIARYITENSEILAEKEASVQKLYTAYQELSNNENTDPTKLKEAKNKYDEAYADYENFYNTVSKNLDKFQEELLVLIPNYTNSWTETNNSANNVKLDFSNYSGETHFILWTKIDNGSKTYYDMEAYTSTIPTETDDKPTTEPEEDWTDFSKAKFELKKDKTGANIEISGVVPSNNSSYYLFITPNADKPNVTSEDSDTKFSVGYNSSDKTLTTLDSQKMASYIELNKDLYISILEVKQLENEERIVTYGKKLVRYEEPKYADAFLTTSMTNEASKIVTDFTHSPLNDRKIQIKVGKITDVEILKKIKDKDSSGFVNLLSYAKSNRGIYEETLEADKNTNNIEYNAGQGVKKEVINLKKLQDNAYYFIYVKAEEENGKYIPQEAVTLAQANVISDGNWKLLFHGSSEFEWENFGDATQGEDNTTAPGNIPQTGASIIMWSVLGIVIVLGGIFAYIKYKKNNF